MISCILAVPCGHLKLTEENGFITACDWTEEAPFPAETALLKKAEKELEEYFKGKRKTFDLPVQPKGTAFEKDVWSVLEKIPYGHLMTYGEIAKEIGRPKASRAVGNACGKNPVCVIIPCHRVVGSNGSLTGYAGGIGRKVKLLEHEGVDMSHFFIPSKGSAL